MFFFQWARAFYRYSLNTCKIQGGLFHVEEQILETFVSCFYFCFCFNQLRFQQVWEKNRFVLEWFPSKLLNSTFASIQFHGDFINRLYFNPLRYWTDSYHSLIQCHIMGLPHKLKWVHIFKQSIVWIVSQWYFSFSLLKI